MNLLILFLVYPIRTRIYVHLSQDIETAMTVGSRHGKPYVFTIDTKQMYEDGYKFYLSENNIYLTKIIPTKYL
ncbi:MAG: RNA 2'-phosphotransferase [Catenibacterium mitsuokai]|nr:RNA 2'-phosphotransferase [Catenibacterium mitsuokai]MEE0080732.1 RNA 2'-phosphotransferase [Catenibacterium mitsuokai]